jgi:pimeloyl-ACP methyl ester carboxylesterase
MPYLSHQQLEDIIRTQVEPVPSVVPPEMQAWDAGGEGAVIILVHGHAVSKKIWTDPYQETIGPGLLSFDLALADWTHPPALPWFFDEDSPPLSFSTPLRLVVNRPAPLWDELRERGYHLLTWTQREPNGPLQFAVDEVAVIMRLARALFGQAPMVCVGFSRGGLVVRKYIQDYGIAFPELRKVIFLSTPHHGSKIATAADLLGDLGGGVPRITHSLTEAVRRAGFAGPQSALDRVCSLVSQVIRFLEGDAIAEMKPTSALIQQLEQREAIERTSGIPYVNLVGVSNTYTKLYIVHDKGQAFTEVASFLDLIPDFLVPAELDDGQGDGLVAVQRARLDWVPMGAPEQFAVNHATILTDAGVRERITAECGTF